VNSEEVLRLHRFYAKIHLKDGDFMEIKAKCKYDLDSVKALTRLTMYKKSDPRKRLIFCSTAFAILFIIIILKIIAFGFDTILAVLLGVEIFGLLLIYFLYLLFQRYNTNH
jgi:hypothetical protein